MTAFVPVAGAMGLLGMISAAARRRHLRLCQVFCVVLCRVIGLEVRFENRAGVALTGARPILFAANHMSYLDVVAIAAHLPTYFVTSREFQARPLLGWICAAAGCVFVERRKRSTIEADIGHMAAKLNRGLNVTIFPEGTTSDGEALLPLKRTLLEAALRSRARVVPLVIQYRSIDGRVVTRQNRDRLAWYGAMTFLPHFFSVLALRHVQIRLTALPPIPLRVARSRKVLGLGLEKALREEFQPIR